jgi:hypothetical protein
MHNQQLPHPLPVQALRHVDGVFQKEGINWCCKMQLFAFLRRQFNERGAVNPGTGSAEMETWNTWGELCFYLPSIFG